MSIQTALASVGIPYTYGHFKTEKKPPFMVFLGAGADTMPADDTVYYKHDNYSVEYYFAKKDEMTEAAIEEALLNDGFIFTKSEDTYIESEDLYAIYYDVN